MKALFIGGTGNLSGAITRQLSKDDSWLLTHLNRGKRQGCAPRGVEHLRADIENEVEVARLLEGRTFDVVVDFVGFVPEQIRRDVRLFSGKTRQFIFISSAVVYQTPPPNYLLSEGMLLNNPHWQYAKDKLACEEVLNQALRECGFPVTIVRPSHTYSDAWLPFCLEGSMGSWTLIKRMLERKPIVLPGDGTSLWVVTSNEDFAKGFIGLMGNSRAIGESVHITSDFALTWNQIHRTVAEALGVPLFACHVPSDILMAANPALEGLLMGSRSHCILFDNAKLKRLVPSFAASVTFEQGANRALRHIMDTPELHTFDADFDRWCDEIVQIMSMAREKARMLSQN